MKLVLGTAQFGMDYGVTNPTGKVSLQELEKILLLAEQNGIRTLDTAIAYGDAQQRLGRVLNGQQSFSVLTKLPSGITAQDVIPRLEQSLQQLCITRISGLSVHNCADLCQTLVEQLYALRALGTVEKLGVSVYHPRELQHILTRYSLDFFQVPMNILDQRFATCTKLENFKGHQLHIRSLLLQGVLVTPLEKLPAYFQQYADYLWPVWKVANSLKVSPLTIAMSIVFQVSGIDKVVIGCCSHDQLQEILTAYKQARELTDKINTRDYVCDDERLILPDSWILPPPADMKQPGEYRERKF